MDGQPGWDNAWFGYFGYGLKDSLERLKADEPNWLTLPNLCMMRFNHVYRFDHQERTVTVWSRYALPAIPAIPKHALPALPPVAEIHSNMSRTEYLKKAAHVIECIHRGDLYQANLTRKFIGQFSERPDPFALFCRLCEVSPAPYSAFLQLGDTQILSSSPELFLQVDEMGERARAP